MVHNEKDNMAISHYGRIDKIRPESETRRKDRKMKKQRCVTISTGGGGAG